MVSQNDYVVMVKGLELTLDDYLEMKELESAWEFSNKKEAEEDKSYDEIELMNEYVVVCQGKKMSLEEYLISKECEILNIAA